MTKIKNKSRPLKNKKIFVAGGTGFLGQRVIRALEKRGFNYVTTSLSLGVDFRNFEQTKKYFQKERPDIVIHCAAFIGGIKFGLEHLGEMFFNNTLINTYLIECSRIFGVERFINPISSCSYPDVISKDFKEDEWWDGPLHESVLSYGFTRKASWVQTWAYHRQYGMNFINFIFPNMYGPGDYFEEVRSHALGALIKRIVGAKEKKLPEVIIWGTGKPVREWLYVDDAVEIIIKSLKVKPFIEPVNIGIGKGITIKNLAYLIKDLAGYEGKLIFDHSKPDGALYKVMNADRCKKIFKWSPKTDIKNGIKKTIEWYRDHRNNN